eukprot:CAMPEP_0183709474 /NCGR_PEP_ID=MMETSP0737-20130205/5522_1 /TAXON_ID=385413 /ORGANISM="Thalassiosira miniscula, Strain CCMP1093" /LENGTH=656 /DNA_ID=CAMNT_0025937591 /DNA_START=65 /DNA_END=2035 /DNA_ORIENTATION=+
MPKKNNDDEVKNGTVGRGWFCCGKFHPAAKVKCVKCGYFRAGHPIPSWGGWNANAPPAPAPAAEETKSKRKRKGAPSSSSSAASAPAPDSAAAPAPAAPAATATAEAESEPSETATPRRSKRRKTSKEAEKEDEEDGVLPRNDPPRAIWRCDICRTAVFTTYAEATAHELTCAKAKEQQPAVVIQNTNEVPMIPPMPPMMPPTPSMMPPTTPAPPVVVIAQKETNKEDEPPKVVKKKEPPKIVLLNDGRTSSKHSPKGAVIVNGDSQQMVGKDLVLTEESTTFITTALEQRNMKKHPYEPHEVDFLRYLLLDQRGRMRESVTDILEEALKSRDLEKTNFAQNELRLAGQIAYLEFKRQPEPYTKIKLRSFPKFRPMEIVQIPVAFERKSSGSGEGSKANRNSKRLRTLAARHMNQLAPPFVREYHDELKAAFFEKYPERKKEKKDKRFCRAQGCLKSKHFDGYCKHHFMEIVGNLERMKELQAKRHCRVEGCTKYRVHRCNLMCLSCFRAHGGQVDRVVANSDSSSSSEEEEDDDDNNNEEEEVEEEEEEEYEQEEEEEEVHQTNVATTTATTTWMGGGGGQILQQGTTTTHPNPTTQNAAFQHQHHHHHHRSQFANAYGEGANTNPYQATAYTQQQQNDLTAALARWDGTQGTWG